MSQQNGTFQSTWIDVNGLQVHTVVSTDPVLPGAPTVGLVHGLGLSHRYMVPIAARLAPVYRVYIPDLPGFGDRGKPSRVLDVPGLADALAAWMRTVGLGRAALFGNSFGCQIIVDLAARYPEQVERRCFRGRRRTQRNGLGSGNSCVGARTRRTTRTRWGPSRGVTIAAFLGRYGSRQQHWEPPEPDGERPEAEWGFESALRADTQRFARQRGYRVVRLLFDDPEHLSPLVADLHRWWHRQRGMPADRLLVESFILMEPWWTMRTGAVPFWMTFTTEPSAAWLERYLEGAEPYNDIRLMLFVPGTDSVGIAAIARWRQLLERARQQGRFVGVDEDKYPRDFATFVRYHSKLKQIADRYPIPEPLTVSQLNAFLTQAGDRYPVQWLADTYVEGV